MLIGIDANEANVKRKVGISEYAYELLLEFNKANQNSGSDLSYKIYLKERPLGDFPPESDNWHYNIFGPRRFWTQFALPVNLYSSRPHPDVFFTTSHYAPRFSPVPTVVSVMDVSYLYFPDLFKKSDLVQLKSWTSYSVKRAARVLTISKSSKNDIIKEYKILGSKVEVVYPGIKQVINPVPGIYGMNTLEKKYGIAKNFVLFVGTLQPRKNISRLIEAFALNLKKGKIPGDFQLVIVGKKGWLYEEILSKPLSLGIEKKVKFLDFINDEELEVLYKHASCFILPSLYEGFGLPVLEAMRYGCPVITSNISSLPEAGGEAALYVDPLNVEDIAEKIYNLVTDQSLRNELKEKGKVQIKKFSWEKTADKTLKILRDVVSGSAL